MKHRRIDEGKLANKRGSKAERTATTRPGYFGAVELAQEVRRRFKTPATGGRGRDPGWTTKRLMPVRRETLARLQELARAVSQIVDYRVEPLQVAALILERDLALWGDPDELNERSAGRTDVRTTSGHRPTRSVRSTQANRLVLLMRVASLAEEVLGSRERAIGWLQDPNGALGNATPLSHLDTVRGTRQVEALLGRIAHGTYS
jgi:putative toxin-antitoxin system antitoxin component (TIGR02293 family)